MNTLKVAALSLDVVWTDRDENIYAVRRALKNVAPDTDIVVLPELFTTGFITDPDTVSRMAEDWDTSDTVEQLRAIAAKFNMALAGSMLARVPGGDIVNRGFFIEPSGETTVYDKKHLFGLSTEARDLVGGTRPVPVIRFRGWNIALAICYDVRFPVWLRNSGGRYDALLVPANWPQKRGYAWQQLLIARAIENQAYVVGVNRSGSDDYGDYTGLTFAYDYAGQPILTTDPDSPTVAMAMLDKARMEKYRTNFPFLADADNFRLL